MALSPIRGGKALRAEVYDPQRGRPRSACEVLGLKGRSFPNTRQGRKDGNELIRLATNALAGQPTGGAITVKDWYDRWTTDPIFTKGLKDSTLLHRQERAHPFVERYAGLPLRHVTDEVVSQWRTGGRSDGRINVLRKMFNDAMSADAGRLIPSNPFAGLGLAQSRGNRDITPPDETIVWALVDAARRLAGPAFAAWLQVAAFTGMRPGELDGLRVDCLDFERGRIRVITQWNVASKTFTTPKNGRERAAIMSKHARSALKALPLDGEFVFTNTQGRHMTPSTRHYHWKATRAAVDFGDTLYLATRHFAGSYMTNVLELPPEDIAIALGHTDGGELVRCLYGHRDKNLALDRVQAAYDNVTPLRLIREAEAS